ncbi:hypothetical protein H4S07_004955, partial [Coemansia furcata]
MTYGYNYDNSDNRQEEEGGERGLGRFFGRDNESQQQQHSGPQQSQYGQQHQGYGNQPQGYGQQQQQYHPGSNMAGGSQQGGNMPGGDYSQEELDKSERNAKYKDWGIKAGIALAGAAAIGGAAYGIHEYREHKEEEREEESRKEQEAEQEKRRHEEEERRRHEEERRRHEDEERRRRQEQENNQGGWNQRPPSTDSAYDHYTKPQHHEGSGGFCPPPAYGRPPYSFRQDDVRHADPSRSSENSPTPHEYPRLHGASDHVIKIGSIISLKHNMTGRFLHTDRSHSTETGSNQQLVYGFRWNTDENDWWQVLPANRDVPVPGSVVAFGTQIRLRH